MKLAEITVGKAYSNGAKGKWLQARTITAIKDGVVSYTVTGGRDPGRTGTMKLISFAQWADKEA